MGQVQQERKQELVRRLEVHEEEAYVSGRSEWFATEQPLCLFTGLGLAAVGSDVRIAVPVADGFSATRAGCAAARRLCRVVFLIRGHSLSQTVATGLPLILVCAQRAT